MTPLPPYVPGSQDTRNFTVEGHAFHVYRGDHGGGEVAFWGGGRDGDYVQADDPRIGIVARAIAGIDGLSQAWIGHRSDSAEVIDTVERRMLALAGKYDWIGRQIWGNLEAARGSLAVSRAPMITRAVYISGYGLSIDVDLPEGRDGIVTTPTSVLPVAAFVEETLTELGAPLERVPGPGYDKAGYYAIPARVLTAFLDKALVVTKASDVRLFDRP